MTETTKKELFSIEDLDNIIKAAQAAPDSDNKKLYNLQNSIRYLYPALCEMRDNKGYSYSELVAFLKGFEIEVAESTLKTYLKKHQKALELAGQSKKSKKTSVKKMTVQSEDSVELKSLAENETKITS